MGSIEEVNEVLKQVIHPSCMSCLSILTLYFKVKARFIKIMKRIPFFDVHENLV